MKGRALFRALAAALCVLLIMGFAGCETGSGNSGAGDGSKDTQTEDLAEESEAASTQPVDIFPDMSKADHETIHTFFSNFSEVAMENFDSSDYTDAELIEFAVWHTYRNNEDLIIYDSAEGNLKIPESVIAAAIEKYFGLQVSNQSVGYVDNPNYYNYGTYNYEYRDGYYYFTGAMGGALLWSQVTSLLDNGDGTYTASMDVYQGQSVPPNLYEDIDDWDLSGGLKVTYKGEPEGDVWEGPCYYYSATAVISLHEYGGETTYKLISIRRE
ncbi:MAG: hypothetical protein LBR14_02810 [Clostridiales Family XIII bacterium]|jgi:hypothetical protein|nr:hypothetical protein [Clostridiales Family XIII bacterium]